MELLGVRKSIRFVAAGFVAALLLVVVGVALLPDGSEQYVDAGRDRGDSAEWLESPVEVELGEPPLDEPVPRGDFMIGVFANLAPTKPLAEARRDCVFEATIQSVDEDDPSVARVLVHEHNGRKTKAVVRGSDGGSGGVDYAVRETVKFFCSSKSEQDEAMPSYDDCQQRVRSFDGDVCADSADCAPLLGGFTSPFRPVYASAESGSRTLRESKDGCVRAATASTGEGCVGFCFNAFVKSVDPEDWRTAQVEIIESDGTRSRAVVRRSGVRVESREPARDGAPVRFACMDRVDDVGGALGFEGCVQMAVVVSEGDGAEARHGHDLDPFDDPLGDVPLGL